LIFFTSKKESLKIIAKSCKLSNMLFQSHIYSYNLDRQLPHSITIPTEKLVPGDFTDLGELAQQLNKACMQHKQINRSLLIYVFRHIGDMEAGPGID
jgi:hypothetical protein